jgi:hypothetical protein
VVSGVLTQNGSPVRKSRSPTCVASKEPRLEKFLRTSERRSSVSWQGHQADLGALTVSAETPPPRRDDIKIGRDKSKFGRENAKFDRDGRKIG